MKHGNARRFGGLGVKKYGLTPSTAYTFDTKARNLDNVETSFGAQVMEQLHCCSVH